MPNISTPIDFDRLKLEDAASYDDVAADFELFSGRLTTPLVRRMVSLARPTPSERVLDIGTGTGQVALEVAASVLPGGKVVGADLSGGMLRTARITAAARGLAENAEFCRMDGEYLGFADGSFDLVLSLFALLHFPKPAVATREMFRVLRPGGRLVIAVGSPAPLFSLSFFAQGFKHLYRLERQRRGKLLVAPRFLDDLVRKHFPEAVSDAEGSIAHQSLNRTHNVLRMVRESKFTDIKTYWYGHVPRLDTTEEFWSVQRTFSSFARKRLANVSKDRLSALQREFFDTCRRVRDNGGELRYPFAGYFICARRPRS
jgi:ubiquinone/menaquinone biosynthesis C-methylase UbiE